MLVRLLAQEYIQVLTVVFRSKYELCSIQQSRLLSVLSIPYTVVNPSFSSYFCVHRLREFKYCFFTKFSEENQLIMKSSRVPFNISQKTEIGKEIMITSVPNTSHIYNDTVFKFYGQSGNRNSY